MRKRPGKPQRKGLLNLVTRITTITALIAFAASFVTSKANHNEKQKELDAINAKAAEIEAENAEMQKILDSDDMDAYMARIAMEKMDYAYPDERRFYDKSRN